jgi:hypothetical protein
VKIEQETTLSTNIPSEHLLYLRCIYASHQQQTPPGAMCLDWPRYLVHAYTLARLGPQKYGVVRIFYSLADSTDGWRTDPLPDDLGGRLVVPSSIIAGREAVEFDPARLQKQRAGYLDRRQRWELLEGRKEQGRLAKAARALAPAPAPVPAKRPWWKILGR